MKGLPNMVIRVESSTTVRKRTCRLAMLALKGELLEGSPTGHTAIPFTAFQAFQSVPRMGAGRLRSREIPARRYGAGGPTSSRWTTVPGRR